MFFTVRRGSDLTVADHSLLFLRMTRLLCVLQLHNSVWKYTKFVFSCSIMEAICGLLTVYVGDGCSQEWLDFGFYHTRH